uniref:BPTI/Kunitz inhibitor domain-containing protein n=1 Tax=Anser cygnoides TaxID=8845 RepID=A0A8B9DVK3_ANSCY
ERTALGFLRSLWGERCWGLERCRVLPPAAPGGDGLPGGSLEPQTLFPAPPSLLRYLFCVADPGTACADFSLRWYHRRDTGACERFWYGGCGGNANRFGTERDCVHTCVGTGRKGMKPPPSHLGVASCLAAACLEARDAGPCRSYSPKWFFEEPGRCSLFWYGGCGGSRNRFESREQCEAVCMAPGTGGTRDPPAASSPSPPPAPVGWKEEDF